MAVDAPALARFGDRGRPVKGRRQTAQVTSGRLARL